MWTYLCVKLPADYGLLGQGVHLGANIGFTKQKALDSRWISAEAHLIKVTAWRSLC